MQSKTMSALETLASTAIGYSVATAANFYILPLFGYPVSLKDASMIGVIFTIISLIRGYIVRRLFTWIEWFTYWRKVHWECSSCGALSMEYIYPNVSYCSNCDEK